MWRPEEQNAKGTKCERPPHFSDRGMKLCELQVVITSSQAVWIIHPQAVKLDRNRCQNAGAQDGQQQKVKADGIFVLPLVETRILMLEFPQETILLSLPALEADLFPHRAIDGTEKFGPTHLSTFVSGIHVEK